MKKLKKLSKIKALKMPKPPKMDAQADGAMEEAMAGLKSMKTKGRKGAESLKKSAGMKRKKKANKGIE